MSDQMSDWGQLPYRAAPLVAPLTRLSELSDGDVVEVTWSGGNGPHRYRVATRGVAGEQLYDAWTTGPRSVFVGFLGGDDCGVHLSVREVRRASATCEEKER